MAGSTVRYLKIDKSLSLRRAETHPKEPETDVRSHTGWLLAIMRYPALLNVVIGYSY